MKIFKAIPMYDDYLDYFYNRNPCLKYAPFKTQITALRNDFFSSMDFNWATFNDNPTIDIYETVSNCFYLQQSYCNHSYNKDPDWQSKILLKQINDFQPDICIIYPPEQYTEVFLEQIRGIVHHKILIGGMDGMDRQNINVFKGYDFVITCSKYISSYYEKHNMPTYALEFGFNPLIYGKLQNNVRSHNVGFSGSIMNGIHNDRLDLLKYLIQKTPLTIHSSLHLNGNYKLLSRKALRAINQHEFGNFLSLRAIKKKCKEPLYGLEMFQFLHDSKITLNMHGDKIKFAANIRLYEATGVGSCLLTDWKENLGEIFDIEKEIVTYNCKEEALDKIKFLLRHEPIRKSIACKGQQKTLSKYSEATRIPGVINFINNLLYDDRKSS